jgi:hypothetical protein
MQWSHWVSNVFGVAKHEGSKGLRTLWESKCEQQQSLYRFERSEEKAAHMYAYISRLELWGLFIQFCVINIPPTDCFVTNAPNPDYGYGPLAGIGVPGCAIHKWNVESVGD